ncbi:MAG: DNA mismatch repair protein MutS [Pseudomonadota bacterium]|nr:DNA mismatch repair protein MutS [Pseudomonadota bacterium]
MTPLMQQYWSIKAAHKDELLFFRMGDFYELFHDDARVAAPVLNIALTSRNKKNADETAMCGMPYHSVAGPINKLLESGFRVAICDQIEDPALAKGIVKRAVTRILSPGMVFDPETLDGSKANYICSVDRETLCFLDATTGEGFYFLGKKNSLGLTKDFAGLIELLSPKEIIVCSDHANQLLQLKILSGPVITKFDRLIDTPQHKNLPDTAKRLLAYAVHMQGESLLNTISEFENRSILKRLVLSPTVIRHLEVFENYAGEVKGSLFDAINLTKTAAGSRLLKSWLRFPLLDLNKIKARQDHLGFWLSDISGLKRVRTLFSQMFDVERRIGKIVNPSCGPRDFISLSNSLKVGVEVSRADKNLSYSPLDLEKVQGVISLIENTLREEPSVSIAKGGVIADGFNNVLDELVGLSDHAEKAINAIEAREKLNSGISSLKIRFNNVFGYYIEVTNTHLEKVPKNYIRRQTLAQAERYITPELQELENKILSAKARRIELEGQLFSELKTQVISQLGTLLTFAKLWSECDVVTSLAWLALQDNYVRPEFKNDKKLEIKNGRHPVVENKIGKNFVPNNVELSFGDCLLLTGPNMAGKSTLMRQVAVLVIMAQIGSFVPAVAMSMPLFHRFFTRIGASDSLAQGLSTFMVEMSETAEMLESADGNSLVILDEIGRGTSTYDGLSLAQSILEFLLESSGSLIFFATHYHELTQLSEKNHRIKNHHMSIHEKNGAMTFLYTLREGPANKSYGIQVAKLAGLPASVTERAQCLLKVLESDSGRGQLSLTFGLDQNTEQSKKFTDLGEQVRTVLIEKMTPLDALNKISEWQQNYF